MNKPWPEGKTADICPECNKPRNIWELEYKGCEINRFGVWKVYRRDEAPLVSLTCPDCKTRFIVSENE